ncbi:3-hydroxyisobutyrate dehydrogenase-like beta-hydroxyacid dehydrogenase [Prauserella shujinwangii]|uniref:3-hydroxyisobutyrate dehydrogenase-like beta-hydroxyacid dehydrogenase n=1 Tax=Prauserella shujinwangii TaxID=1453103 RepID=A0A2T0LP40_9PSEU|nr:3-hydroxyisobutyrate dehydrogenase-like beta-hydroxyacid dehydrogenase [Prauserella shujinwangii]
MNDSTREPVTVIGLGPMGQAMVRVLLGRGHRVTVWNRTAARADAVVAEGAVRAGTPAEALAASELVLLSLTDYQAMYDILGAAEGALGGRVVVNLSSDTPQRTRDAAGWLAERGARLLVGGIMVPAELVGSDQAYVFYSGPKAVFDAHEETLRPIGRPDHRGEDPALAQLYYQAQLDIFLTSLSAYLHATALLRAAGVEATTFLPYATETFDTMSYYLGDAAREIEAGTYPGDLASVTMMGATADHIVGASAAAGIDLDLPRAVRSHYARAIAAGHGKDSWTSLFEVISRRDDG